MGLFSPYNFWIYIFGYFYFGSHFEIIPKWIFIDIWAVVNFLTSGFIVSYLTFLAQRYKNAVVAILALRFISTFFLLFILDEELTMLIIPGVISVILDFSFIRYLYKREKK